MRVIGSAWRFTVPGAVLGIGWQTGEALVPLVMGVAIDRAIATGDPGALLLWLVVLGGVFLMLSLSYRFASRLAALATEKVQHRLRSALSRSLLHADGSGAPRPDGAVVSLMTNDVMRTAAVGLMVFPVAEFSGVMFIAVSLLVIHWPLGLAVLVGAPATVWIMGLLSGRLARDSRIYQGLLADTVGRATDLVSGYRVIKGIRAEDEAARRYREASRETLGGAYRNIGLVGRFTVGSSTVSGVFVAAVAALAGWFAVTGQLSVGGLIASVGLAQGLLPPMRMLAMNAVPTWAGAVASAGRVIDALRSAPGPGTVTPDAETASFADRIAFAHAAEVPAVEVTIGEQSVWVDPGEVVGLRADERTGAAIAEALLLAQSGGGVQLAVGGEPVRNLHQYRSAVMVSPHHATLFSGTIAENLVPDGLTQDGCVRRVEEALRAASCEEFVVAGGGVDAPVGEMGGRFSGGQRQRLALARALAADAPVLVMHDPTTAVDSVTDQQIASRLRGIRAGGSTLLIASSPALLAVCDRVVDLRSDRPGPGSGVELDGAGT